MSFLRILLQTKWKKNQKKRQPFSAKNMVKSAQQFFCEKTASKKSTTCGPCPPHLSTSLAPPYPGPVGSTCYQLSFWDQFFPEISELSEIFGTQKPSIFAIWKLKLKTNKKNSIIQHLPKKDWKGTKQHPTPAPQWSLKDTDCRSRSRWVSPRFTSRSTGQR